MRRHREQLQSVATSGVDGKVMRTAPQWHEPSCIGILPVSRRRAVRASARLVCELGSQVLGEFCQIDDHACVRAAADFLRSVDCTHAEFDMTTGNVGDFGKRDDPTAYGSRRKMADIDAS